MALFFVLLAAVGIVVMLTFTRVAHANNALEVKKTLYVSIEMDDRGTEIISLLNSDVNGIKYMEVMGDMAADNDELYIDENKEALEQTLMKIKRGGYNFYLTWPGGEEMLKNGDLDCGTVVDTDIILLWPVPDSILISSPYETHRGDHLHGGIDIPGQHLNVIAADVGEVVLAGWQECCETGYEKVGFGKRVTIKHTLPGEKYYYTIYGHLEEFYVEAGDTVARGQLIGKTGNTGASDGYHLHFELADGVMMSRTSLDPCPYLGNLAGCSGSGAPPVSASIYGTEIPLPGGQPGMLKGDVDFLC